MPYLARINKGLFELYNGKVWAVYEDNIFTLEGKLENWDDLVHAGVLAAKILKSERKKGSFKKEHPGTGQKFPPGLVNKIECTGETIPPMSLPPVSDKSLEGKRPDVLIIGGGVTGNAIARELARYDLDILLVEKEHDVAKQASSRNDGMVHPGLDLSKSSKKYHYNRIGNKMYDAVTRELGVPFKRTGQYLCFTSPLMIPLLFVSLLYWKWLKVPGARVLLKKELHDLEPGLKDDLNTALFFPNAGVVCPYSLTIAYAENAVENGVTLSLDTAVLGMKVVDRRITEVRTNRGVIYPRITINAAGVFADDVAAMAEDQFYSIHPRRGTNSILDKKVSDSLIKTIASKRGGVAGEPGHTKGGGLVRTAHGNLLVGPDAVETWERENFATGRESINATFAKFKDTTPDLSPGQIITYFTGVRAATYEEDFVVCPGRKTVNLIHAAGIQSPGLTAAPAIAVEVSAMAVKMLNADGGTAAAEGSASNSAAAGGSGVQKKQNYNPIRKPIPHTAAMADEERQALIKANPDYGIILCRCEEVSRGEILDSLRRPVPCDTVDGVKRRVRPGMGRCQGGFCGPLVAQIIAEEKNIPLEGVMKSGPGSPIVLGPTKGFPAAASKKAAPGSEAIHG
jgi:glycerol-3-phosphate dehydrogenase